MDIQFILHTFVLTNRINKMDIQLKETKQFKATGIVLGNLWMGGTATLPIKPLEAYSREEIVNEAKAKLADGTLTGTGDFDGLIGVILNIETTTLIIYNGKKFTNVESEILTIGDLTDKQDEFLLDRAYYMGLL